MNYSETNRQSLILQKISSIKLNSSTIFAAIILSALVAFEIFNYSTTDFALRDLLGDLKFAGMRWATILSIAFCGIDFAGIARLFTPEEGNNELKEVWYLFGAWLLAATMNAALTWWGVSMALTTHNVQSASVVDPKILFTVVPLFVALMVWVIRILIIGSLSVAGDKLFNQKHNTISSSQMQKTQSNPIRTNQIRTTPARVSARPQNQQQSQKIEPRPFSNRAEPTYHSFSNNNNTPSRKL